MNDFNLLAIAPILTVTGVALVILLIEALVKNSEKLSFGISVIGLLAAIGLSIQSIGGGYGTAFNQMVTYGGYGSFFSVIFITSALLTIILSRDYLQKTHTSFGEFYLLILFALIGMMLMASAADLIVIFLGLELMSICLYVLAGFMRKNVTSNESSLKYFLLGAFATGFLLYGIALLYGSASTTNIATLVQQYPVLSSSTMFWCGIGLLLIGLGFKVGAVPFHMWIPDVYQGSPTTISGFMSTGAKAAAFSALMLVFARHFEQGEQMKLVLAILAASSMILGNVVAIAQSNIKRMLAYSSIAHAGYMLVGLAANNQLGKSGIIFYLTSYMFTNIGAFGILSMLEKEGEGNLTFDDYAGLGTKKPVLAMMMAMYMFSLAGIPPFGGFFGKYYIFLAAINSNLTWLAILGVMTSLVSVYFYLRLVMVMYFQDGLAEYPAKPAVASFAALALASLAIIQLGIFPSALLSVINNLF